MDLLDSSLLRKESPIGLERTKTAGMAPHQQKGGGETGCAVLPHSDSAIPQKINSQVCQEAIKEDTERPFSAIIPPLPPDTCREHAREEVVSDTGYASGTWLTE